MTEIAWQEYDEMVEFSENEPLVASGHNWLAMGVWLMLLGALASLGFWLFTEGHLLLMLAAVGLPLLVLCLLKPAISLYVFVFAAAFDAVTAFGEEGTVLAMITLIKPLAAIVFLSCFPLFISQHIPLRASRGLIRTFVLLALLVSASIMWSFTRFTSIQYSLLMFGQIVLLLVMVNYVMRNVHIFRNILLWLVAGGVACSVFLFFVGAGMTKGFGRASLGEGANTNAVAIGLVVSISVLPLLWVTTVRRSHRILILAAGLIIYGGIFYTGSKAGAACALLGVLVGGIFEARQRGFLRLFRILGVFLIIFIVTYVLLQLNVLPGGSQTRLEGMFRVGQTIEAAERGGLKREGVWRLAWITYRNSGQMLVGVGAGAIQYANMIVGTCSERHSAHNNFIQALVELGPLGLILILLVHIYPVILLMRLRNRKLIPPAMVALSAPLLAGLTHGTWTTKFFWIPMLIVVLLCEADAMAFEESQEAEFLATEGYFQDGNVP